MQQSVVNGEEISIAPGRMDVNLTWLDNMFYFANEPLEAVIQQISRWYDVDVNYEGHRPATRHWGQMSKEQTLQEMLDILSKANDIEFEIEGKEVRVTKK